MRGFEEDNADRVFLSAFIRVHLRLFSQLLQIVVKHSSMTNQTHLFRQLNVCRADKCATPGTDDLVNRWLNIPEALVLRIDILTQFQPS